MILLLCVLVAFTEAAIGPRFELPDFLDEYARARLLQEAREHCPPPPEEGTHLHKRRRAMDLQVNLSMTPAVYHLAHETVGRTSWELRQFFHIQHDLHPCRVGLSRWYEGTRMSLHSDVRYDPDSKADKKGLPYLAPGLDYACMLYLNDDFEGGELYFQEDFFDASRGREVVQMRANLLVCFQSTMEGWHGVREVTRGERMVLTMWFTNELRFSGWMHNTTMDTLRVHQEFLKSVIV